MPALADLINDLIALIPEDGSRLTNDEIRAALEREAGEPQCGASSSVGAPFQGQCPTSEVNDGGCLQKPDHLNLVKSAVWQPGPASTGRYDLDGV